MCELELFLAPLTHILSNPDLKDISESHILFVDRGLVKKYL